MFSLRRSLLTGSVLLLWLSRSRVTEFSFSSVFLFFHWVSVWVAPVLLPICIESVGWDLCGFSALDCFSWWTCWVLVTSLLESFLCCLPSFVFLPEFCTVFQPSCSRVSVLVSSLSLSLFCIRVCCVISLFSLAGYARVQWGYSVLFLYSRGWVSRTGQEHCCFDIYAKFGFWLLQVYSDCFVLFVTELRWLSKSLESLWIICVPELVFESFFLFTWLIN